MGAGVLKPGMYLFNNFHKLNYKVSYKTKQKLLVKNNHLQLNMRKNQ